MKKKCTSVILTTGNAETVQVNPANGIYIFRFGGGPLGGSQLHVNSQNGGEEKDVFIINQEKPGVMCEPLNKDSWKWNESFNEAKMTVSFKAAIQLRYEGKEYCIDMTYEGDGMKMMMPPAPGRPLPLPEEQR